MNWMVALAGDIGKVPIISGIDANWCYLASFSVI